jgi:hypothetical protein
MSLNLPKSVPLKYRSRIGHWDDERECGNSLIVSLNAGWRFPVAEGHVQGFDTVREAIEGLRESEPCGCVNCLKSIGVAA